jgi:hypothetical protein
MLESDCTSKNQKRLSTLDSPKSYVGSKHQVHNCSGSLSCALQIASLRASGIENAVT